MLLVSFKAFENCPMCLQMRKSCCYTVFLSVKNVWGFFSHFLMLESTCVYQKANMKPGAY